MTGIAVVGMTGRFPGAPDVRAFWKNLRDGVESIEFFSEAEMLAEGADPAELSDVTYVGAGGVIDGIEEFDATFFGYTPREAAIIDPQQRLFLQAAWAALEDAGYSTDTDSVSIGVFAGVGLNRYFLNNVCADLDPGRAIEDMLTLLGSDKDYLATRVSFHLNLTGPSFNVQSACSTSLLAVVQACQALDAQQCDMALAGGVFVRVPQQRGYLHVPEGVLSPDGHCRAFDARGRGTAFSSGLGIVVLKRLEDAVSAGDQVHAVIRGAAVNNDGSNKLSYTAPSVDRQAAVIAQAQALGGIDPDTIGYVEAHGTGTTLGDPVEVAALTQAFRARSERSGYCALGSVKTNIGHLAAASGVAGLIKTVLALKHRAIPPSLHLQTPNPLIDFAGSPFFVNTVLREWPAGSTPRRAGVSSFGVGGTNTHVVLEEAPEQHELTASQPWQLLLVSARTAEALQAATTRLADHLEDVLEVELADVAFTLQVGRRSFDRRHALVCRDRADALLQLRAPPPATRVKPDRGPRTVGFVVSGDGLMERGAWRGLFASEPAFREQLERCCDQLRGHLGVDLLKLLVDQDDADGSGPLPADLLEPARFAVAYSCARVLMDWGVRPAVMIGQGVGELVAACLSQVFRLEVGLTLVSLRGRWLAASEADREPLLTAFVESATKALRKPPEFPFVSCISGAWIQPSEALDPAYWVRQMDPSTRAVEAGAAQQLAGEHLLIEIGAGAPSAPEESGRPVIRLSPQGDVSEARRSLLGAAGQLWSEGVRIDWSVFGSADPRRRVSLPTYPFARERHWMAPSYSRPMAAAAPGASDDPADWLHVPVWRRVPPLANGSDSTPGGTPWLLLIDDEASSGPLVHRLREQGQALTLVRPGDGFASSADGEFVVDPANSEDHRRLVQALQLDGTPIRVVHLWLASGEALSERDTFDRGFGSLHLLTSALRAAVSEVDVTVVTAGAQDVVGDALFPERATVTGACKVLPQERPGVMLRHVDVEATHGVWTDPMLGQLVAELRAPQAEQVVACRGGHRWLPGFEVVSSNGFLTDAALRPRGAYLITGGLGGIGLTLARFLAQHISARIALTGRTGLPARELWEGLLDAGSAEQRHAIQAVQELEALGAEVLVMAADVADRGAMAQVFETIRDRFGALNGVVHAAGVPGRGVLGVGLDEVPQEALRAKRDGTHVLLELCGDEPDFIVLCSSISTVLGGIGQADYVAANAFMDALATSRHAGSGPRVVSIGWDTWSEVGMAANAELPAHLRTRQEQVLSSGLSCEQGVEVFRRALASEHAHVLVSTTPLDQRVQALQSVTPSQPVVVPAEDPQPVSAPVVQPGSSVPTRALPPEDVSSVVTSAWIQLLGLEQADLDDSFFEQGGNSLLATQLLARLAKQFPEAGLSLRGLFERPTLAGLVETIQESQGDLSGADEQSFLEQVRAADGEPRRTLLADYLRRQVSLATGLSAAELPADGNLAELDQMLIAGQLASVLHADLDLPFYPSEVRQRPSIDGLVELIAGELDRLSKLLDEAEDAPASEIDPVSMGASVGREERRLPQQRNPSMIFLLSAPRSGSTLLRLMLSAHPGLFCPPELFLLDNEGMRGWSEDPFHSFYSDGLVRALMALRDISHAEAGGLVDALVARDAPVHEVYRLLQDQAATLVDKTPTYALSRSTLQRAEDVFDRPHFIGLVRHPHAVIESMVRNRLDRIRRLSGNSYALAERYWVEASRNALELRDALGAERFHLVRYEELVREPSRVLAELCQRLGVGYDEDVLDPYGKGRMFGGPGDPHLFARGAIDPTLAETWRDIRLPRPLGEDAAELAGRLGFELPD